MDGTTDTTMTITGFGLGRAVAIFAGFLVLGLMVLVYASYQGDIRRARQRIAAGSQIVKTACGQIEYAVSGDGPTVLVAHGAGGGYDQGLDASRELVQSGFRVVAMSRFGYLRTPLPVDASPAAQADAYACLLNDASITPFLPRYELERISAPTLTLSTADDGYGTYAGARYSAEHIPNARFIGYPSGGHLLVGHYEEAITEVTSFLELYAQ